MYILENTDCIKGKGLSGEFVYGWDGKDLVLLPIELHEYKEISEYNKAVKSGGIKAKDLVAGYTYKNKQNKNLIYLGRFDYYNWKGEKSKRKKYFFSTENGGFIEYSSISSIIQCFSKEIHNKYADMMDNLESYCYYSPIDESKTKYVKCTEKELEKLVNKYYYSDSYETIYKLEDNEFVRKYLRKFDEQNEFVLTSDYYYSKRGERFKTLKELVNKVSLYQRKRYLKNGKQYKKR